MFVLIALAGLTYYSHRRVEAHKLQLRQFDEERTHILEQMMWIEKKKSRAQASVTSPTAQRLDSTLASVKDLTQQLQQEQEQLEDGNSSNGGGDDKSNDSNLDVPSLMAGPLNRQNSGVAILRNQMEKMQLRIQLNDRNHLLERFKNKPIQITLGVQSASEADNGDAVAVGRYGNENNNGTAQQHDDVAKNIDVPQHNLVIALSEDTPHATSVFLQQVEHDLWNDVYMKRLEEAPNVIEATTILQHTTPVLSFVEASIGCHEKGSVAIHQIDRNDQLALVVRIRLSEDTPTDHDEVCIGKVLHGMNYLEDLPLPRHMEDIGMGGF